eukprot:306615-Amphidinium_carterae.1
MLPRNDDDNEQEWSEHSITGTQKLSVEIVKRCYRYECEHYGQLLNRCLGRSCALFTVLLVAAGCSSRRTCFACVCCISTKPGSATNEQHRPETAYPPNHTLTLCLGVEWALSALELRLPRCRFNMRDSEPSAKDAKTSRLNQRECGLKTNTCLCSVAIWAQTLSTSAFAEVFERPACSESLLVLRCCSSGCPRRRWRCGHGTTAKSS